MLTQEAEASVACEKDDVNGIRVADRLARPHPLVRAAAEALKGQSADTFGRLHRPRIVKLPGHSRIAHRPPQGRSGPSP
jgi:hypothetical protein